jgi:folate-binding protein YgfZ
VSPAHDLLWVEGPDAATYLDGLVSQSVLDMADGSVRRSLLLSPRGKLDAPLWLLAGSGRIGIAVDGGHGGAVASSLSRFKLRVEAEIVADDRPLTEVWGEVAGDLIEPGRWIDTEDLIADLPMVHGGVRRVLTTRRLDVDAASPELGAAMRIAAGEPRLGVDIGEDTIPQEAGIVDGAVDFEKGCYLGQELVARIDSRGHVNRYLRGLRLQAPVAAGSEVRHNGAAVGSVTSSAVSPDLGPIALAMIRSEVEVGHAVTVGAVAGTVTGLPMGREP